MVNFFHDQFKKGCTPVLIKVYHEDMAEPLYLTDNNEDLTYDGITYKHAYFKINLPEVTKDSMGNASIEMGCVDQQIINIVRSISTPPNIKFVATYYEDGIYSELAGYDMIMSNVKWDAKKLTADLTLDIVLNYEFPAGSFTAFNCPGVA